MRIPFRNRRPFPAWQRWSWTLLAIPGLLVPSFWPPPKQLLAQGSAASAVKPLPPGLELIPPDSFAFVYVRVADLWGCPAWQAVQQRFPREAQEIAHGMQDLLGAAPEQVEGLTLITLNLPLQIKDETKPLVDRDNLLSLAVVTFARPYDQAATLKSVLGKPEKQTFKGQTYYAAGEDPRWAVLPLNDRTLIAGLESALKQILDRPVRAAGPGPLGTALDLARDKHLIVSGFNFTPASANVVKHHLALTKGSVISRALLPLLEVRSGALTVDTGNESRLDLQLRFHDEPSARNGRRQVQDILVLLRFLVLGEWADKFQKRKEAAFNEEEEEEALYWSLAVHQADTALKAGRVEQEGLAVRLTLKVIADPVALRAQAKARVKADGADPRLKTFRERRASANNLKTLGLALRRFHDEHGYFPPPAITDKDGKPLLSWRVAILPYLKEVDLYRQFDLDQPWDSAHNVKLLEKMPAVYAPVGRKTKEPYKTFYQAFVGKGAAFERDRGTGLNEFQDGTANTFLVAEAAEPVPWTKSEDLAFDPKKSPPKLGGLFTDGFNALYADGSVRFAKKGISAATLRALITRNGGEVLGVDAP